MNSCSCHRMALTETSLTLPAYRLYNLETLSEAQTHIRYDQEAIVQQQAQLMKQETSFALPDEFVTCLRDYQKEGFQWLKTLSAYGFGGLLADDMGLGKDRSGAGLSAQRTGAGEAEPGRLSGIPASELAGRSRDASRRS